MRCARGLPAAENSLDALHILALTICALGLPYYVEPLYSDGAGYTLAFGLVGMSCSAANVFACPAAARYDGISSDTCSAWLGTSSEAACSAFQAAGTAAASLGAAGQAMYILGLLATLVCAVGGGLAAGRGRSGSSPALGGAPGALIASPRMRVPAAWLAWFLLGAGAGLGANAASLVFTAQYNNFIATNFLTFGTAGAGLGLGAFACLLAFVVAVLDTVACAGCCCGRQEGVVIIQTGGGGHAPSVVVVGQYK